MNNKYWMTGLLALALVAMSGCGQKPTIDGGQVSQGSGGTTVTGEVVATENEVESGRPVDTNKPIEGTVVSIDNRATKVSNKVTKLSIDVYYTDDQVMELKKAKQEIHYATDEEKYEVTLKALQSSGKTKLQPLWEKVVFKEITFKEGELTIDISLPDEARLGAGGEAFALEALTNTLFQFEEVQSIELLVDGRKVESLMGHVDLSHPMKRF